MLLIDFFEKMANELHEIEERGEKLKKSYYKSADNDIRKEIGKLKIEKRKVQREIKDQIMINLEEFKALDKYFPEFFEALLEDPNIGSVIKSKLWLFDFEEIEPDQAGFLFLSLKDQRAKIKQIQEIIKGGSREIDSRKIIEVIPTLQGKLSGKIPREEALGKLNELNKQIIREGWLLLLTSALIKLPLTKYLALYDLNSRKEILAKKAEEKSQGKGTLAETNAKRYLEKIQKKKEKYLTFIKQILLSNPKYLESIKEKGQFLKNKSNDPLLKIAKTIVPKRIKEAIWLKEMRKRLEK